MQLSETRKSFDFILALPAIFLTVISIGILYSTASYVFPQYFIYIFIACILFYFFSKAHFKFLSMFYWYMYVAIIFLLILPPLLGEITRGTIRWIPLGPVAIQPSEIVRPFLIVFFANYLAQRELSLKTVLKSGLLILLPVLLIVIQPSLGVASLTIVSYIGVVLASTIDKRYILAALFIVLLLIPPAWFIMQPYQRDRITSFLDPASDPLGAGYNSIQATISVGSGKLFGRGLGEGVQTQLLFLPERHNDFIFASVGEELGFIGILVVLSLLFGIMWRLTFYMENSVSPVGRAYISGFLLVFFAQIIFNAGMNMQLFPITGIPLPLVSAGGSSLIATAIGLGIARSATK